MEQRSHRKKEGGSFRKGVVWGIILTVLAIAAAVSSTLAYCYFIRKDMGMLGKVQLIRTYLNQFYIEDVDEELLEESIYKAMAASQGDPYTTYMTVEETEDFKVSNTGVFTGIGVEVFINDEGYLQIMTVLDGGPAKEAGILSGDYIVQSSGTDLQGLGLDEAISYVRGKKGTEVQLRLYRPSEERYYDLTLVRKEITNVTTTYEMLEDNIGYIRISQFKRNTPDQFREALNVLTAGGMEGLVLDVRSNPGGLFDAVVEICDQLLEEGLVVYTVDYDGKREDSLSTEGSISVPFVLLVNGSSASASEILAGAVQDRGAAPLVGTQTFGKGVVQQMYPLPDGSSLKITMQKYYTPNGVSIHGTGITPDYVVEAAEDDTEDVQLQKAISLLKDQLGQ